MRQWAHVRRLATGWAGALAVIVAVTGGMSIGRKPLSLSAFDQPFYLGIAHDLLLTGRFTNGFMFDVHGPAARRGSGMRFAPLYPAMLAVAADVDPQLRRGMACVVVTEDKADACGNQAPVMRLLQFAMLAAFFLLVWWIGGAVASITPGLGTAPVGNPAAGTASANPMDARATGAHGLDAGAMDAGAMDARAISAHAPAASSPGAGGPANGVPDTATPGTGALAMRWLGLALALIAAPTLLRSVDLLMTEMTCLLLSTAAIAAWLRGQTTPGTTWPAIAGACLALTALTRPGFLYLLPFSVLCAAALGIWQKPAHLAWRRTLAMAAGGACVLAPWLLRNRLVMGRTALTYGYDSHTLVQRIAFDTMTWREYKLAYLCWLPDGTSLGRRLVGPGACDRFGWDEQPTSFYSLGIRHMLDETLKAAGGYEHHLGYLLHTYIFAMPLWHIAVSVPLALRGAYIAHWWGFMLLPVCLWVTAGMARRGNTAFLAVALPAFFMLAFNASVSVNQVRYNLLLVPAYAAAGALGLRAAATRWHDRRGTQNGRAQA